MSDVFNCDCGYTGPYSKFCPQCGALFKGEVSVASVPSAPASAVDPDSSKRDFLEHGWKSVDGFYSVVIKDGNLVLLGGSDLWLESPYSLKSPAFIPGMSMMAVTNQVVTEFDFYIANNNIKRLNKKVRFINKLRYVNGRLVLSIFDSEAQSSSDVEFVPDDSVTIGELPKGPVIGWTCKGCGMTNQIGKFCNGCGAEIAKVILLDYYEKSSSTIYQSPYFEYKAYEFSSDEIIIERYENGGIPGQEVFRNFAPVDVLKEAEEIISKYDLRSWNNPDVPFSGWCGGINVIKFKDGDGYVRVSTEKFPNNDSMKAFGEMKGVLGKYSL